jgi:hypothetical protein
MERLPGLRRSERKLRAAEERGHVLAPQSFVALFGPGQGEALCGRGTNRPEGELSIGSGVAVGKGD